MAQAQKLMAPEMARDEILAVAEKLEIMDRDFRYDPLYGIAMLKVSFNLRPQRWMGFDDIMKDTLRELQVNEQDLDQYVDRNLQSLQMACKMIGI